MANLNEFRYEILFILAGLSFGNTPILSALLRDQDVSSLEQVFIRSLIASLFGLIVIVSFFLPENGKSVNHYIKPINFTISYKLSYLIL